MTRTTTALTGAAALALALAPIAVPMAMAHPLPDAAPQPALTPRIASDGPVMSGPGVQFHRLGTLSANSEVTVDGCSAATGWCQVSTNDITGWVPARALGVAVVRRVGAVSVTPDTVSFTTVRPAGRKRHDENVFGGALAGAAAGGLLGGPLGLVAGAMLGGAGGSLATGPTISSATYITHAPDRAVTRGKTDRVAVTLAPLPGSRDAVIGVDGVPFLATPHTRTLIAG